MKIIVLLCSLIVLSNFLYSQTNDRYDCEVQLSPKKGYLATKYVKAEIEFIKSRFHIKIKKFDNPKNQHTSNSSYAFFGKILELKMVHNSYIVLRRFEDTTFKIRGSNIKSIYKRIKKFIEDYNNKEAAK
jgi:hypothetical protein